MKIRVGVAAAAITAALALGVGPFSRVANPAGQAQNYGQRVVDGVVIDGNSAEVSGATVFLRNSKTKSIRSFTSSPRGRFRFTQVNMSDDYDLWAEKDGKKSAIKTISSWDTRKEVEEELKIK
jgi:hypothetical protein